MRLAISHIRYKEKAHDYRLRADVHGTHEICYVDRGRVDVVTGGARLSLEQGDLCLFLPYQEHAIWSVAGPPGPNLVTVDFDTDFRELRLLAKRKLHLHGPARARLASLVQERDRERPYRSEMEEALLAALLVCLLREREAPVDGVRRASARTERMRELLVDEAVDYIRAHLREPLSVGLVADVLHVSTSHLSHSFSSVLSTGVMQVLREARIDQAKRLLRSAPLTVTEVAVACGFASVHHFSRVFKQATGFTPGAYARSLR